MIDSPPGLILINRSFDDVDDWTAETRRWNLDFRQLDCGPYRGEVFQALIGRVMISEGCGNRVLQQKGTAPPGVRTLAIAGGDDVRFNWRSHDITGSDIMIVPNSGELYSVSQRDFHIYTMSLPEDLLAKIIDRLEAGRVILAMEKERISCPLPLVQRLRAAMRRFVTTVKANPSLLSDPSFVRELEYEIPRLFVDAMIDDKSYSAPCNGWARAKTIWLAMEFISQNEFEALTVGDVCEAVGVSERTLQSSFLEHFSISPKAYLKAIRLTGVRRLLKTGDRLDATIAHVASNLGILAYGPVRGRLSQALWGAAVSDAASRSAMIYTRKYAYKVAVR